jgi:hypothetical protein
LTGGFEDSQIRVDATQEAAPAKSARLNIVQYADERLEALYLGGFLKMRHCSVHEHFRKKRLQEDRTFNARVDTLAMQERRMARLALEIRLLEDLPQARQDADTRIGAPLDPICTLKGTFQFWVDNGPFGVRMPYDRN